MYFYYYLPVFCVVLDSSNTDSVKLYHKEFFYSSYGFPLSRDRRRKKGETPAPPGVSWHQSWLPVSNHATTDNPP